MSRYGAHQKVALKITDFNVGLACQKCMFFTQGVSCLNPFQGEDHMDGKCTVILGASPKKERYSNKALCMLREYGHRVIPVHPVFKEIEGIPTVHALGDIKESVHTLTMYVGPARSESLVEQILALRPVRVIFNPGSESEVVKKALEAENIAFEEACTLVMLRTGQF